MEALDEDSSDDAEQYEPSTSGRSATPSHGDNEDIPRLTRIQKGKGKAVESVEQGLIPTALESSEHYDSEDAPELDWYRDHLVQHERFLYSHKHGALTESLGHQRPFQERLAQGTHDYLTINTSEQRVYTAGVGPSNDYWTPAERTMFFGALARHSRLRPDLIAQDVGSKTEGQVVWYLESLRLGSSIMDRERKGRTGSQHGPAWAVWREGFAPAAREVIQEWVNTEERLASSLVRKTDEQNDQAAQNVKEERRQLVRASDMKNAKIAWKKTFLSLDPKPDKEGKKELIHAEIERLRIYIMKREERWAAEDWLLDMTDGKMKFLGRQLRMAEDEKYGELDQALDERERSRTQSVAPGSMDDVGIGSHVEQRGQPSARASSTVMSTTHHGPQVAIVLSNLVAPSDAWAHLIPSGPRLIKEQEEELELSQLASIPRRLRTVVSLARERNLKETIRMRRTRRLKAAEKAELEIGEDEPPSEIQARLLIRKSEKSQKQPKGSTLAQKKSSERKSKSRGTGQDEILFDGNEIPSGAEDDKVLPGELRRVWLSDRMIRESMPFPELLLPTGLEETEWTHATGARSSLNKPSSSWSSVRWKRFLQLVHKSPNAYVPESKAVLEEQMSAFSEKLIHGNSRAQRPLRRTAFYVAAQIVADLGLDFFDLENVGAHYEPIRKPSANGDGADNHAEGSTSSITVDTLCWFRAQVIHNLRHMVFKAIELQEQRNTQLLLPMTFIDKDVIASAIRSAESEDTILSATALYPSRLDFSAVSGSADLKQGRYPERASTDPFVEARRPGNSDSDVLASQTDDSDWSVDDREEKIEVLLAEVDGLQDQVYQAQLLRDRDEAMNYPADMGSFNWSQYRRRQKKRKNLHRREDGHHGSTRSDGDKSSMTSGSSSEESDYDGKFEDHIAGEDASRRIPVLPAVQVELVALQEEYHDRRIRLTKRLAKRRREFDNHGVRVKRRRPRQQPRTTYKSGDLVGLDLEAEDDEHMAVDDTGVPHWYNDEQRKAHDALRRRLNGDQIETNGEIGSTGVGIPDDDIDMD